MIVQGRKWRGGRFGPAVAWCVCAVAAPALGGPAEEPAGLSIVVAVRITLEQQPDIRLSDQAVEIGRGDLEVQRGAFDTSIRASVSQARDRTPLSSSQAGQGIDQIVSDATRYSIDLRKPLRTGLVLTPAVQMDRTDTNVPLDPESRATVWFTVSQPLIRGRGRSVAAAGETAQGLELDAIRGERDFTISRTIVQTASAYWDYVAAIESLEIARESEQRFRRLESDMAALIEGDQIPAADIKQPRANRASRTGSTVAAEQRVFEAQQALGLAMGSPFEEIVRLPPPSDRLPEVPAASLPEPGESAPYIEQALARRGDLVAARARVEAAEVLVGAARNGVRPRLDLLLQAGYKGLGEGPGFGTLFSPFGDGVKGIDVGASLVVEFPPANRTAQGRLARSQAFAEQARILAAESARAIRSSVAVAVADLSRAARRVGIARETTELFRSAVDDQNQKLRLGIGTVIDLILTEDRLIQAELGEVAARRDYAAAVVRLRFETGSLLQPSGAAQQIDHATITSPPPPGAVP